MISVGGNKHRRLCEITAVPMFVVSPYYAVAIVVASSQNRAPSWGIYGPSTVVSVELDAVGSISHCIQVWSMRWSSTVTYISITQIICHLENYVGKLSNPSFSGTCHTQCEQTKEQQVKVEIFDLYFLEILKLLL